MKKSIYIWSCIIILSVALIGICMIRKRISKAEIQDYYTVHTTHDSILNISIIGDSWAEIALQYNFNHYLDSVLYINGIKSQTYIKGTSGAKSKEIYLNMFSEDSLYSSKNIIKNKPQYCIVFAGINDLHGQYGSHYYTYHTSLIIKTLMYYNIKPILVEIPFFFNLEQYESYPFIKQNTYKILSLLTSHNIHMENLYLYRLAMESTLAQQRLENSIIYIRTDSIFKKDRQLYTDNMHISLQGYKQLGNIIIQQIIRDYKYIINNENSNRSPAHI